MVEALRGVHGLDDSQKADPIIERFQKMFNDRTGPALNEDDFNAAVAEAQRRTAEKIPPGYADADKGEPYGDYLIWKQILLEAEKRKIRHLVFITRRREGRLVSIHKR